MARSVQTLEEILAACLDDMQAGMTSAECLARYPEYADRLQPMLLAAERLQNQVWPALSTSGRVRGRERMHAALASRRPAGFAWWPVLRPFSVAVMLLVLAAGVWLAWPGRQQANTNQPTPTSAIQLATSTSTVTLAATSTPTVTSTPTPTGTAGHTSPTAIATGLPGIVEEPGELVTPFASATRRSTVTPPSGTRLSTPNPTQTGEPVPTTDHDTPVPPPDLDRTPAPTVRATEPTSVRKTPTVSRTREPEGTPEPPPTARPTEEPRSTATREPTATLKPTETPQPSAHCRADRATTRNGHTCAVKYGDQGAGAVKYTTADEYAAAVGHTPSRPSHHTQRPRVRRQIRRPGRRRRQIHHGRRVRRGRRPHASRPSRRMQRPRARQRRRLSRRPHPSRQKCLNLQPHPSRPSIPRRPRLRRRPITAEGCGMRTDALLPASTPIGDNPVLGNRDQLRRSMRLFVSSFVMSHRIRK